MTIMKRAFEGAVSALCYAFIRAHFGARAGEPGPPWNNTVRFVLAQHARMPDYLRLPFQVLTLLLDASAKRFAPGLQPESRAVHGTCPRNSCSSRASSSSVARRNGGRERMRDRIRRTAMAASRP